MSRTTYKIAPGKYLHLPTQSIIQNKAHGEWVLLNSTGLPVGSTFPSKARILALLDRGEKTVAQEPPEPVPPERPEEETRPVPVRAPEQHDREDGVPSNCPVTMRRVEYLAKVAATVAPPKPGFRYVVVEVPQEL